LLVNIIDSGHQGEASITSGIKEKSQYMAFLNYYLNFKRNKDLVDEYDP
jgi:hypothetical protein